MPETRCRGGRPGPYHRGMDTQSQPLPAPVPEEDARRHREEVRRLGAKYAACHAELLRRLGE